MPKPKVAFRNFAKTPKNVSSQHATTPSAALKWSNYSSLHKCLHALTWKPLLRRQQTHPINTTTEVTRKATASSGVTVVHTVTFGISVTQHKHTFMDILCFTIKLHFCISYCLYNIRKRMQQQRSRPGFRTYALKVSNGLPAILFPFTFWAQSVVSPRAKPKYSGPSAIRNRVIRIPGKSG